MSDIIIVKQEKHPYNIMQPDAVKNKLYLHTTTVT